MLSYITQFDFVQGLLVICLTVIAVVALLTRHNFRFQKLKEESEQRAHDRKMIEKGKLIEAKNLNSPAPENFAN